jgi:hypothetical protein
MEDIGIFQEVARSAQIMATYEVWEAEKGAGPWTQ